MSDQEKDKITKTDLAIVMVIGLGVLAVLLLGAAAGAGVLWRAFRWGSGL